MEKIDAKIFFSRQIHGQSGVPVIKKTNRLVRCADGFHMSVQAGPTAYSEPRDTIGPYKTVEIGFPSQSEDLLLPYAENPEQPTDSVYGWVPKSVVTAVIVKHGGMVDGDLPNGIPYLYAATYKNDPI